MCQQTRDRAPLARSAARRLRRIQKGIVNPPGELRSGVCAVCGVDSQLVLDHDHTTGKVRGWLCNRCNIGLGWAESEDWVKKARAYLVSHQ